ncbi:MAG: hypothetical protein KKA54_15745 [Proteobacteria bacterium]|nr:hypothetical protein [Pseudomonadota bacterium]
MAKENRCCCMIAAFVAFVVVLVITYVSGYSMGHWTSTTWLAVSVIVVTAGFCWLCRSRENNNNF